MHLSTCFQWDLSVQQAAFLLQESHLHPPNTSSGLSVCCPIRWRQMIWSTVSTTSFQTTEVRSVLSWWRHELSLTFKSSQFYFHSPTSPPGASVCVRPSVQEKLPNKPFNGDDHVRKLRKSSRGASRGRRCRVYRIDQHSKITVWSIRINYKTSGVAKQTWVMWPPITMET